MLDITPILNRELLTATRRPRLWGSRVFLAGILVTIALTTFGPAIIGIEGKCRTTT